MDSMPIAAWWGAQAEVMAIHHRVIETGYGHLSPITEEAAFALIYEKQPYRAAMLLNHLSLELADDSPLCEFVHLVTRRLARFHTIEVSA